MIDAEPVAAAAPAAAWGRPPRLTAAAAGTGLLAPQGIVPVAAAAPARPRPRRTARPLRAVARTGDSRIRGACARTSCALRGALRRRRRYLESAFSWFMKGTMKMSFAEYSTSHERCLVQSHVYTNCRAILKEVSLGSSLGGRSTATWCGLAPSCMGDNQ